MRGRGHIQHRGGDGYRLMVFLGRVGGKQRFRTRTIHGSRREAERELLNLLSEVREGATGVDPTAAERSKTRDVANLDRRAVVIAAARRCFNTATSRSPTVEEIAREAGMSRQYLYHFVSGRSELLEEAVQARLRELLDTQLRPLMDQPRPFTEAIVELSVAAVEAVRCDTEIRNFMQKMPTIPVYQLFAGPSPHVQILAAEFFIPTLKAASVNGELRGDLDYNEIVSWLRSVLLTMILREDLDPDQEREMMRKFVVPSLLTGCRAPG
jgi:AcrR family transcriptional regulator